jgi:hypothetical protein
MPIKVNPSETEQQFIGRCMSEESSSFPDESQRYAVCIGYWENRNMKRTTQQSVNQKIADIGKKQEMIEPNPCESGYIAIGLKPKGGRMVPNCVPVD